MPIENYHTVKETAEIIGKSYQMVYHLIATGKMKCHTFSERFKLITDDQIAEYLKSREDGKKQ